MAQTCALIALVQPILHRVSCRNETLPCAPKHYKTLRIGCIRCKKFQCDFMPRTFALNPPFQTSLYRVSRSNEIIQNAPKHYKMHQLMSLASNGVDRVRSLRKTLMQFRGTNVFINCTCSTRYAPSFVR